MTARIVLAPQAALDILEIWRYIKDQSRVAIADRVESAIKQKMLFLSEHPEAGHRRTDLTDVNVRFFPVYSYLIVYRPEPKPLQIVSIIHGSRDVEQILRRSP